MRSKIIRLRVFPADTSKITLNEMTAQAFVFFQAGFETSTLAVSLSIYHICLNPEVKQKVIDEVDEALAEADGNITYELIQTLRYLDKVVHGE